MALPQYSGFSYGTKPRKTDKDDWMSGNWTSQYVNTFDWDKKTPVQKGTYEGFLHEDIEALLRRGEKVASGNEYRAFDLKKTKQAYKRTPTSGPYPTNEAGERLKPYAQYSDEEVQRIYDAYLGRREQVLTQKAQPGRKQTLLGTRKSLLG